MIRKLTGITPPKDTDFTLLWRYMSFEKFQLILCPDKLKSVKEHYERTINNIATLEKFQENWHKYTFCSAGIMQKKNPWHHMRGIVIKTTFNMFLGFYPVPQNQYVLGISIRSLLNENSAL